MKSSDRAPEGYGDVLEKIDWSSPNEEGKIGFHDCTLVSHERDWKENMFSINRPKVMLLPCRDPLEHFFSQCKYNHHNATKIFANVTLVKKVSTSVVSLSNVNIKMIQSWDKVLFNQLTKVGLESFTRNKCPQRVFPMTTYLQL